MGNNYIFVYFIVLLWRLVNIIDYGCVWGKFSIFLYLEDMIVFIVVFIEGFGYTG